MKHRTLFSVIGFLFAPAVAFGACSANNLTRCLDSVCAINIGANAAARCQYCGSATAGEPPTTNIETINGKIVQMKNITAGGTSKYTISDKELKKAPKDPGQRYVWATEQCLKKVSGCTTEDVSDTYDSLIEQSCEAAGIAAEMLIAITNTNKTKTKTECSAKINACVIDERHCLADYRNCESDVNFDKYFSQCSISSPATKDNKIEYDISGCDSFLADIRSTLISDRNSAIKNAATLLQSIVKAYQDTRTTKLATTQKSCKDNSAKQICLADMCDSHMRHKCGDGYEYELQLAEQLCKYYDTACSRLK